MLQAVSKSTLRIAASLTLLLLLAFAASEAIKWSTNPDQADFEVYLTAAHLVRNHQGIAVYNSADTGQNPQMHFAPANSTFQHTASVGDILASPEQQIESSDSRTSGSMWTPVVRVRCEVQGIFILFTSPRMTCPGDRCSF